MQYEKQNGKIIGKLGKQSVDTGAGLERLAMTMQNVDNIYDTDLLKPIMEKVRSISPNFNIKSARIVSDHIRSSVFLIADGVKPSNTDRGYVLRKLIRRAVRHANTLGIKEVSGLNAVVDACIDNYMNVYTNIREQRKYIVDEISEEEKRFRETLHQGLKEFEKGTDPFVLFSSYGFPLELTIELAKEQGKEINTKDFEEKFRKHQELSRIGAEKKFKGGLENTEDEMVIRYHTATHLLHQALCDVLGNGVMQKGSNITHERLRFDFAFDGKMTNEQKKEVEDIVNRKIKDSLPVNNVIMKKANAENTGAKHFFGEKYGEDISIYFIGNDLESAYSKEFCGGPHVKNTRELAGENGSFKFHILKEESVAQGIRRIKAVLK